MNNEAPQNSAANPSPGRSPGKAPSATARVVSINRSGGGVPKEPVTEALMGEWGLAGDRQEDLENHGGPERAVVIYSLEVIQALQQEGHPIRPGSVGENLTVSGLDWPSIIPGAFLRVGGVKLLVTRYTSPCYKISGSFLGGNFSRISQKLHPGWSRVSARVVTGGIVRQDDPVEAVKC